MIRKLATIVVIESISPHPNADSLEKATMVDKDWKVVPRKGEFKPGDIAIFVEPDSVLPEHPDFKFLEPYGFKVRKMVLRGELSQGLLLRLDSAFVKEKLPNIPPVDTNVTEILGIKLAETKSEDCEVAFPTHIIPQSDEERVKSELKLLDEMKGKEVYISEKADGTSATNILFSDEFLVCGKNYVMKKGFKSHYFEMAEKYNIERKLRAYKAKHGIELAIGYEIIGPGIQKNHLNLAEKEIRVFSVYDTGKRERYGLAKMTEVCKELDLPMVKIMWTGRYDFKTRREALDHLFEMALGKYDNSDHEREGLVVRPMEPVLSKVIEGGMSFLSFKYVTKEDATLDDDTVIGEVYFDDRGIHVGHRLPRDDGESPFDVNGKPIPPKYADDLFNPLREFRGRKVRVTIEEIIDEV